MPFLAGERITASRLNRLQPTIHSATASATLAGPTSNTPIPGLSFTVTTTMPNAEYLATWFTDFDYTTANTGLALSRLRLNGAVVGLFSVAQQELATDRVTAGQQYNGILAAPGTYTFELVCTVGAGISINTQSTLSVVVTEVA